MFGGRTTESILPILVLMEGDAVTINCTANVIERRIWSMNSKQEELQQMYGQGIVSSGGHSANSGGARFQLESADRIEQADVAGAAGNTHQTLGAGDESGYRTVAENSTLRAEGYHSDLSGTAESSRRTVGNSDGSTGESNSGPVFTGWEVERGIWLEAERARRIQAQAKIKSSQVDSDLAVGIDSIVGGVATMASIIEDEPADDTEYARENVDRKALAEERERKEALGIHMG